MNMAQNYQRPHDRLHESGLYPEVPESVLMLLTTILVVPKHVQSMSPMCEDRDMGGNGLYGGELEGRNMEHKNWEHVTFHTKDSLKSTHSMITTGDRQLSGLSQNIEHSVLGDTRYEARGDVGVLERGPWSVVMTINEDTCDCGCVVNCGEGVLQDSGSGQIVISACELGDYVQCGGEGVSRGGYWGNSWYRLVITLGGCQRVRLYGSVNILNSDFTMERRGVYLWSNEKWAVGASHYGGDRHTGCYNLLLLSDVKVYKWGYEDLWMGKRRTQWVHVWVDHNGSQKQFALYFLNTSTFSTNLRTNEAKSEAREGRQITSPYRSQQTEMLQYQAKSRQMVHRYATMHKGQRITTAL
ncbi:hypothetical protein Tco_0789061 [Tanacetum coccineum]